MRFRRIWTYVLLVVILAAGVGFAFRHNEVLDWLASRGYRPSALIRSLVEETAMTPYAERLFYANRPEVQEKDEFNENCTDPSEQVAVLGCFIGNRLGIFIYDVTDDRLNGIEQVTAAHEMLHQAYQRLGGSEKKRINSLLQDYHDRKASEKLKAKIASYKNSDREQLLNEMHSIFGTESMDLPSELEEYYKQYFTDRSRVLALYHRYQSEFDSRLAQIQDYDARLESLRAQIESDRVDIARQEAELRARRVQLDSLLANNSINAYNAAVPGFNSLVVAYRELVNATNAKVEEHNRLLAERNEIAVQERELEAAIDSSVDAAARQ